MSRARTCAAASLSVGLLFGAGSARADKMTDAEELFRRAKALMADHKDRDACPLFEESEKLDPQMGTLLNLAICHENIGRVASAWGEFRAVEQMAKVANREDRIKLAHERAQKLESRLPRLKIVLPAENRVNGLTVKVDGEVKAETLWGGVAVDPGLCTVDVSAPGKKTTTAKVKVDGEGVVVPFTLPHLEDEPIPAKIDLGPDGTNSERDRRLREEQYAANRSRRTKGFVIAGAGAAVMAVGGVFGVMAILKKDDAPAACPAPCIDGSPAAKNADDATSRALLFANVANVAIPIGALVTLIGGYMILSAGPTRATGGLPAAPTGSTLLSRAYVSPSLGGATLGATW